MRSPKKTAAIATFFEALRLTPSDPVLTDGAALHRDAQAGLDAAERLRGYGNFLEQARSIKAKSARAGGNVDREVYAQSLRALEDANTLAVSTLRAVRNMYHGGSLAGVTDTFRRSLQRSGPIAVVDIWAHATTSTRSRGVLERAGISEAMRAAFDATVRAADVRVSADAGRILVDGSAGGAPIKTQMTTKPRPAPSRITDLLFLGRFDALADAFESGEPAYLSGLALPDDEPRPEEVALAGVLATYHDMVRHVRKLEDIGLASYRGAGPVTILIIVAAALIVAGAIVGYEECPAFTTLTEGSSSDSLACGIAKALFSLGLLLLLLGITIGGQTTQQQSSSTNLTGSPVVHGVVLDFVSQSS